MSLLSARRTEHRSAGVYLFAWHAGHGRFTGVPDESGANGRTPGRARGIRGVRACDGRRQAVSAAQQSRQAVNILRPGQTVREAWEANPDSWRRQLLGLLIDRIEVLAGTDKPLMTLPDGRRVRFAPQLIRVAWKC